MWPPTLLHQNRNIIFHKTKKSIFKLWKCTIGKSSNFPNRVKVRTIWKGLLLDPFYKYLKCLWPPLLLPRNHIIILNKSKKYISKLVNWPFGKIRNFTNRVRVRTIWKGSLLVPFYKYFMCMWPCPIIRALKERAPFFKNARWSALLLYLRSGSWSALQFLRSALLTNYKGFSARFNVWIILCKLSRITKYQ